MLSCVDGFPTMANPVRQSGSFIRADPASRSSASRLRLKVSMVPESSLGVDLLGLALVLDALTATRLLSW